jgi:2,4-dienoyl-CoA reductase-like NADH-dependent reductase (Old Yellow Enzyme family)
MESPVVAFDVKQNFKVKSIAQPARPGEASMSMWRPPQRIKFDAQPGHWPSAAQAGVSRLFSPVSIGPTVLSSRTWVPAMVPWRATEDGFASANVLDWYRRFAQGRPGAIVVEATGVRDVPSGPLLRIGDDRFIPGLERLVQTVREASGGETRLFIQLIDFLAIKRRPDPHKFIERFLTITDSHRTHLAMPCEDEGAVRARLATLSTGELEKVLSPREWEALTRGLRERVTDCELPQIRALPQALPDLFARAARRAQIAGFDGVELHYAHSYTMASFLSATNNRTDGYGGAPEHRIRLPLEVYAAVRDALGRALTIGCRLLADECIGGGSGVQDASYFTRRLAAAGIDFVSLSRGGKFEDALQPKVGEAIYPYTGPSGYECMPSYYSDGRGPFGRNREAALAIRSELRAAGHATPIIAGGGVHNFEQAEAWLAEGAADAVSIARQALADPDWFRKVRTGQGGAVRLCKYTNYCEALDRRHREVTCELWDRLALDAPGTVRSKDGKRRLVAPEDSEEAVAPAPASVGSMESGHD